MPITARQGMIDHSNDRISVRKQSEILGITRSCIYYHSTKSSEEASLIKTSIDEAYTEFPFYGSRRISVVISEKLERNINRKHVQRVMREMGIQAIGPKPSLSKPFKGHKIYPYLLRGKSIVKPNEVWSTDITYIRLARGFAFLTAVIDWYSRFVLSWKLSNTLDSESPIEALKEALGNGKLPTIFNTDQGSQFTSEAFTKILLDAGVLISMDGRGRALDNVFVERLWRSVKYEDIYPKGYETLEQARSGLTDYFEFYNQRRPHQALEYRRPAEIYYG